MKKVAICCAALLFAACSSPSDQKAGTDSAAVKDTLTKSADTTAKHDPHSVTSLCFLHTEGKTNQDTTSIELVVKGDKVTGVMNWLPYQKDSRKGTLEGTMQGDTIAATWSFMQEGMKDTIALKFKLDGDQLWQKPLKLNVKTGRDQTDLSSGYSLAYRSSNKVKK